MLWKEFHIKDLGLPIIKPIVYHTKNVCIDNNGINYVVRSKFNNGIKYKVKKMQNINPAGVISFGAENATFFYQEDIWISGRDIYYIDTSNLSKLSSLFLVSVLQTITKKYSYNFGMFPELVKEEIIKLPVDKNNKPNWQYMENYMKNIISTMQNNLTLFQAA